MSEQTATKEAKSVKDRAGAFNVAILLGGILLAVSTFFVATSVADTPDWIFWRVAVVVLGIFVAGAGFWKSSNERKFKAQEASDKRSLSDELQAERLRILTITNGAFQSTARRLQDLAAVDLATRKQRISGFRQSVVEKACELVLSDNPRAAYFQVEETTVTGTRKMSTQGVVASRGRFDEFTTSFEESSTRDSNVWTFIDESDDADMVLRIPEDAPAGFDLMRLRQYKSYISVPVRAGTMSFGMLTINNLERDGFDEQDKASMRVLSRLLAAAEAMCISARAQNLVAASVQQPGELSLASASVVSSEEVSR